MLRIPGTLSITAFFLAATLAAAAPPVTLRLVAEGLTQPLAITHAGDGSGRLFIVEKTGRIRILKDGALRPAAFLEIPERISTSGERGLLGLAFDPLFAQNRRFFVFYARAGDGALRVASFLASALDPDRAEPASEREVITIPHPGFDNHNGGHIAFGPDGFLYVATGDGGGGGDAANNAQTRTSRLGKILRLDVRGDTGYVVPATNPFASTPGVAPEICAYGLRNPWRFSFDRATGDLFIADVGQNLVEEVNYQPGESPGGQNYGWRVIEGTTCFAPPTGCSLPGATPPVLTYGHDVGQSITGGYVYRGLKSRALQGYYLYGDFSTSRVWAARREATGWTNALVVAPPSVLSGISSFGEDEAGELHVASLNNGRVFAIEGPATARTEPGVVSGLWWNPQESGWGVQLTQRGDAIFAALFHYGADGTAKWYVASNCARSSSPGNAALRCTGALEEVHGPRYFGVPFNAGAVQVSTVGSIEIAFKDSERATLTYSLGSLQRTVALQRQVFRSRAVAPSFDYTDLYFNRFESGWGLTVSHQADILFVAWYVYDDAGLPVWYVASSCALNGAADGCTGVLYRSTGPPITGAFNPGSVQAVAVGQISIAFTGANDAVLTYSVDGVQGSKTVSRQVF